jgi:hypothetical protein
MDTVKAFGREALTVQGLGGAAAVGVAHGFVAPMVAEYLAGMFPQSYRVPVLDVEVSASSFAFTATGLVTEPGLKLTVGNDFCTAEVRCGPRGVMTIYFSKPVKDPVISFAGWGGGTGNSTAWTEMALTTPNLTMTVLSGTNIEVINSGRYIQPIVKNPTVSCQTNGGAYGATATAAGDTCITALTIGSTATDAQTSNVMTAFIIDIQNYKSTTQNKTVRSFIGTDVNGTGRVELSSALRLSTSAVSSITMANYNGAAFTSASVFSLYGIKGA